MGGVLDGIPPLVHIDSEKLQQDVDRRRPGVLPGTSPRKETDKVEILSGINSDGFTLGTPIGFIVRNRDARSGDYDKYATAYRPNHADFTYQEKYGIRDPRGGGRQSARETVSWVVAGAICRQWLEIRGITASARFEETNNVMEAAAAGDTTGGIVRAVITGLPVGVGEPVFDKLHARLALAMMSINAAKAFEYGDGFKAAYMLGSESVDTFNSAAGMEAGQPRCRSNHSGGVQGGISNGMPVEFSVYFKPTPTLMRPLETIDTEGCPITLPPKGRHDPCVAIRAVPVVEALALLTVADLLRISGK